MLIDFLFFFSYSVSLLVHFLYALDSWLRGLLEDVCLMHAVDESYCLTSLMLLFALSL